MNPAADGHCFDFANLADNFKMRRHLRIPKLRATPSWAIGPAVTSSAGA